MQKIRINHVLISKMYIKRGLVQAEILFDKNYKIPSLNGLRAISISLVVGSHFGEELLYINNPFIKYLLLIFNGSLGVNIFFIISGFLITILLIKERKCGNISLKKFYIRRTLRIFPAYYFFLLICLLLQISKQIEISPLAWIASLTYTKQFTKAGPTEFNPLWSLSVEEFFYLLWPWVFIFCKKNIICIVTTFIILISTARMFFFGFPQSTFALTIFSRGDAMLIGCLAALKFNEISALVMKYNKYIYLIIFCLILSITSHLTVFSIIGKLNNKHYLIYIGRLTYSLFGSVGLLTNFLITFIVIYSILIKNIWFKILNSSILNHIGKLSYSIYLYHSFFTANKPINQKMSLVGLILCIYLSSYLSYVLIEKPFLKLKSSFSVS